MLTHIRQVLSARPDQRASEDRFLRELEDFVSEDDAAAIPATAIDWGRYAELFEYDANTHILTQTSDEM